MIQQSHAGQLGTAGGAASSPDYEGAGASAHQSGRAGKTPAGEADAGGPLVALNSVRPRRIFACATILLALLALALAAWTWYRGRQFHAVVTARQQAATATASSRFAQLQTKQTQILHRLGVLGPAVDAQSKQLLSMASRVADLPSRVAALEKRVDAGSGLSDARQEWLRSEAGYYLSVANTELILGGHWQTAITALELADEHLRQLAAPDLIPVRQAIAKELRELRSVQRPDLAGLAFRLQGLSEQVSSLPFPSARILGENKAPSENDRSGLGRLWESFKQALAGLISVRKVGEAASELQTVDQKLLARRQLKLQLQLARAAALNHDAAAFTASIDNALGLLARDFDGDSTAVRSAVTLLTGFKALDVAPARPDISASLRLFRQARGAN